jgi:hypothetical protein
VPTAVLAALRASGWCWLLTQGGGCRCDWAAELDFTPGTGRCSVPEPAFEIGPEEGPVMVTLEYQIDPARAADFAAVMERTRRARLRQGALSWGCSATPRCRAATSSTSSTRTGSSTSAGWSASPPSTPNCANSGWPSTSAKEPPVLRRYVADVQLEKPDMPL